MLAQENSELEAYSDAAREHLLVPAQELETLGRRALPFVTEGEGVYLVQPDGRRIIDGPGGMWCTQVGYGCKEIADAMHQQAMKLCYNSPWYTSNVPASRLAARLAELAPGDLNRVFFTTGGSTAVDSALRLVEYLNNRLGRPHKKNIVVRLNGYHGSTKLTASCSGRSGNWSHFDIGSERIHFISTPAVNSRQPEETRRLEELVEEFRVKVEELGPDTVAAFLAEPVMGSGGVIIPPRGYHARIKEICQQHNIVYISDEVVTGFGRCGAWFASKDVFGVQPDIITFAKGITSGYIPLGGFIVSDRLLSQLSGPKAHGDYFTNGYTYSGHPVACAAALANIEVIEQRGLLQKIDAETGPAFAEMLEGLRNLAHVSDIRYVGLVGCVQISLDPEGRERSEDDKILAQRVDTICLEGGLLVRPVGDMCVLSPALIISAETINEIGRILREAILRAAAEYRAGQIDGLARPLPPSSSTALAGDLREEPGTTN